MIRILLADDHTVLREGMSLILSVEEDLEVVGQAANGEQAVALAADLVPDVVLMDIQMPVMDGIEAAREVLAATPATKVVMLTTFEREDYLFDAVVAGASGFLLKNTEAEQIVEAVRAVHAGRALLSPEVTLPLLRRIAASGSSVSHEPVPDAARDTIAPAAPPAPTTSPDPTPSGTATAGNRVELTPREEEVLRLLAAGLSNGEIAKDLFIGEATVKTHVSDLLLKLQARDRVQAVVAAYRQGYVSP